MIEVTEVNDLETLAHYRLVWNSLFASTPNATFFLTIDWLETAWRHFGDDHKLRVLIVTSGGEPIGILPLCVRNEKYRFNNVRVLTYPLDNWSTWYGPIGPNPSATMLAAMQHIRRTPRDWDMIELRWVPDDDSSGGRTARALRIAGLFTEKQEYQTTSLLELPSDWETFLSGKSRSLRSQFRRQLRRPFEELDVTYVRHRPDPRSAGDGEPAWDVYSMCEEVAAVSWQSSVERGNTLTHKEVRQFYREAHAAAAKLGMVDMNVLLFQNRPVAFLYNYCCNGRVYSLRIGYVPEFTEYGFGSTLLLTSVRDSIDRGDSIIDFGPGDREHKRRLRTRVESTYRLSYTPLDSWRSQTVRWTRWAKNHWTARQRAGAIAACSALGG